MEIRNLESLCRPLPKIIFFLVFAIFDKGKFETNQLIVSFFDENINLKRQHSTMSNNVTRLLDAKKISYQVFSLPEEKLGAQETAKLLNVPANLVYKTIVAIRPKPGKPILAVIPGDHQLDLKALAQILNEKKVSIPTEREAEKLTGLQAGGISPLALINKSFQVLIDSQAEIRPTIHISGGQRGLNIRMSATDLLVLTRAQFGKISQYIDPEE